MNADEPAALFGASRRLEANAQPKVGKREKGAELIGAPDCRPLNNLAQTLRYTATDEKARRTIGYKRVAPGNSLPRRSSTSSGHCA